ncbi:MAG: hypothetical protein JKY56_26245, partial [Kofleriaceae bacterium]|nr:hypothetical protein [Kofleriaceae bacterium]
RRRAAALLSLACGLLGAALAVEQVTAFVVRSSAPSSVDFNEYRWIFLSPWSRAALIAGLFAAATSLVFTGIATRTIGSAWRWSAIVGLRFAALATALVLFFQPAVELRQVTREPNRIAILVDDSESMELTDKVGQQSRRERVRQLIDNSASAIASWRKSHIVDVYRFSEELARDDLETTASTPAKGKATLLRLALEKIRRRYEGDKLAGIVVISDGVVTGDLAEIGTGEFRDFARELDTPVHTVWAAQAGIKDLAVQEVNADEFAFVRSVTRIEATIHATGFGRRRVPVTLSSDGKALRRKWVTLAEGDSSAKVFFEFTPSHVGKFVYKISIPVEPDEAVIENNSAWFVIRVIRDKIRVLQVAGQPSWDVRAFRGMLKQNPNVDLISFFILRTNDDIKKAGNDELSLIPFPTRELFEQELPSFDLIVLQNFNYGPYGIGRYLENIRSYVDGGGGLAMLGGPLSFSSGHYNGTPVADALPVILGSQVLPAGQTDSMLDERPFQAKLTKLGDIHPVTALRYESSDNRTLWSQLPKLEGLNKVLRARKGAAVLAVHPTLRDKDNKPMPVIIADDYGKGRSLAVTTDSLWRWGFIAAAKAGNDGRNYLKFWDNAIRWLIQDPELRYLHVDSDRNSYSPGDTLGLNIRMLDQDYSPLANGSVSLTISRGFDPKTLEQIATHTMKVGSDGEGSYEIANIEAGVYRVVAEATVRGRKVRAHDIFLVHKASIEKQEPAADPAILRMVSQLSGGISMADIEEFPSDLPFIAPKIVRVDKRSDVSLWNLPWLLLCALLFLGLEWLLRQRSGSL